MKVILLRGPSGSGKTTWAKDFVRQDPFRSACICSADDYFVKNGVYRFVPAELPDAHAACLRQFTREVVKNDFDFLIVDNTNTRLFDMAPYAALAQAYAHQLEIIRFCCDWQRAAARNVHGVPQHTVRLMDLDMEQSLPRWGPETRIWTNAE